MLRVAIQFANSRSLQWLNRVLWAPLRRIIYPSYVRWVMRKDVTPVVIYQMGKVASKTVDATLCGIASVQVFHAHMLGPDNIAKRRVQLESHLGKTDAQVNIDRSRAIYDYVIRSSRDIKIITLIREPIGRNISAFFQGLDRWVGVDRAHDRASMTVLTETFLNDYPHRDALTWFDDEFRAVTGIDVYSFGFPKDKGHQRIRQGRFDVLIMRHDLDDSEKAERVAELLNLPGLKIVQDNRADDKEYRDSYREFQKAIRLPRRYVEEMLDSKYALHFFPDAERERLRNKWLRQSP